MGKENKKSEGNYSEENIQVLEGLEAVRKRPAMFIGDLSYRGLHHMVWGIVGEFGITQLHAAPLHPTFDFIQFLAGPSYQISVRSVGGSVVSCDCSSV